MKNVDWVNWIKYFFPTLVCYCSLIGKDCCKSMSVIFNCFWCDKQNIYLFIYWEIIVIISLCHIPLQSRASPFPCIAEILLSGQLMDIVTSIMMVLHCVFRLISLLYCMEFFLKIFFKKYFLKIWTLEAGP